MSKKRGPNSAMEKKTSKKILKIRNNGEKLSKKRREEQMVWLAGSETDISIVAFHKHKHKHYLKACEPKFTP